MSHLHDFDLRWRRLLYRAAIDRPDLVDQAVRLIILMFVVLALIYIFSHQPRPVAVTVLPYCEIDYPAAIKDRRGAWHRYWGHSWGPCTLMDRYEEV